MVDHVAWLKTSALMHCDTSAALGTWGACGAETRCWSRSENTAAQSVCGARHLSFMSQFEGTHRTAQMMAKAEKSPASSAARQMRLCRHRTAARGLGRRTFRLVAACLAGMWEPLSSAHYSHAAVPERGSHRPLFFGDSGTDIARCVAPNSLLSMPRLGRASGMTGGRISRESHNYLIFDYKLSNFLSWNFHRSDLGLGRDEVGTGATHHPDAIVRRTLTTHRVGATL
jgi:hypothetical protein